MNLLQETLEILAENNKIPSDILWVGSLDYYFSWEEFVKIADVEYDNGYGSQKVASDLLIVGKDFYLEREEYDGSECWAYKTMLSKPIHKIQLTASTINQAESLGYKVSIGWESLALINNIMGSDKNA